MKQASTKKNTGQEEKLPEEPISPPAAGLESRLEWIVRLAQHDIQDPEGAQALRTFVQQMGTYLRGVRIHCQGGEHGGSHLSVLGRPGVWAELPMREEDDRKPLHEKLALIRAALQWDLKKFLHPNPQAIPLMAEVTVRCTLNEEGQKELHTDWITDDVREGLRFRLLEDLAQADGLLRACARDGCGKIFVRHYRQEFCSTSCRNRTNVRKWYQRSKDKRVVARRQSGAAESSTRKQSTSTKKTTRRANTK
jgi:hypothetical protein